MLKENERLIKYVTFDGIKKDSFLRYFENQALRDLKGDNQVYRQ